MSEPPAPGYVACSGCGAGWGRPHFERCQIDIPVWDLHLGVNQIRGLLAYALSVFPLTDVRRSTIRAMLPRGERTLKPSRACLPHSAGAKTRNRVTDTFGITLRQIEEHGWIWRTPEQVRIFDRQALLRYAKGHLPACWWLTARVHEAIGLLAENFPPGITPDEITQRDRELAALRKMMQESPATGPHAGRGYVRITPPPPRL
jgi:hypothetical protein